MSINTLAEIKRTCNQVFEDDWVAASNGTIAVLSRRSEKESFSLPRIQHPTKDFELYGDGTYYFVLDTGGMLMTRDLYKVRNPI